MCNLSVMFIVLLPAVLLAATAHGFFMPVFVRKPTQSPVPAAPANSGWAPAPQQPNPVATASAYKDYNGYHLNQYQPVPIAPGNFWQPIQQYTYEAAASMAVDPYKHLQPVFRNVQMVPCMCPLTRDVIDQQLHHQQQQQQQTAHSPATSDSNNKNNSQKV